MNPFDHPLIRDDFHRRFWKKVSKTEGCWNWIGAKRSRGYGSFMLPNGFVEISSRASWVLHFGKIPKGKWVLHHCDNTACVRPDHLYLGDHYDNVKDALARGRYLHQTGEKNGHAKMTWKMVNEIRERYKKEDTSCAVLSKEYKISRPEIYGIVCGNKWRDPKYIYSSKGARHWTQIPASVRLARENR